MTFFCLIDANPEPDIRWFHRLGNDINHENDLSRQLHQGSQSDHQNGRRMTPYWFIEQEQINATRWKTSLLIKVSDMRQMSSPWFLSFSIFPKRFLNSTFLCRAVNRHGQDEKTITVMPNHHYHHHASKKHRHTTTEQIVSTTDLQKLDEEDEHLSSFTTRT